MQLRNKHIVSSILLIYCISFGFIIPFHNRKDADYIFTSYKDSFRYNCNFVLEAEHQRDANHSHEDNQKHSHDNCSICYTYNLSNGKLIFIFVFFYFPLIESITQLARTFFHLYILSYYHLSRAPPNFI